MIAMGIVQSWTFLILLLLLVGFITKPLADWADRVLPDFNTDSEFDDEDSEIEEEVPEITEATEVSSPKKEKSWTR